MSDSIPEDIRKDTIQIFDVCHEIVQNKIFNEGTAYSCKLYNVFDKGLDKEHNCIACNFADYSESILRFLKRFNTLDDMQHDGSLYILVLYSVVERILRILQIIKYPESDRTSHFSTLIQINRWANFVKHPKSFVLTHHPTFNCENSGIKYNFTPSVLIDNSIVSKYYSGIKNNELRNQLNSELHEILKNKKNVLVMFPGLDTLTTLFCEEYNYFIDMILNNSDFVKILSDEATLEGYFTTENED